MLSSLGRPATLPDFRKEGMGLVQARPIGKETLPVGTTLLMVGWDMQGTAEDSTEETDAASFRLPPRISTSEATISAAVLHMVASVEN